MNAVDWHRWAAAARRLALDARERAADLGAETRRLQQSWRGMAGDAAAGHVARLRERFDEYAEALLAAERILTDHATCLDHAGTVESADLADAQAAGRLRDLLRRLDPTAAAGADPAAAHQWWNALSDDERRWLFDHEPARIGALDGLPADVRDRANRIALDRAASGDHRLDALRARLARTGPDRAYLLGFDPGGDGRAIVSVGNPDLATNIVTLVPGMGSDLRTFGGPLTDADHLAGRAGPGTAVVAWLGYDAPDNLVAATSNGYARDAGAALARFQEGLRASHEGGPAHLTVVGHSYGSTVVGYTSHERGLQADDIVFVGSPGVGVNHATGLGVPAGHVWSSTARWDAILATGLAHDLQEPPLRRLFDFDHADDLWFGANPSRHEFGAHVFASDPGRPIDPVRAHLAYFDVDNTALDNMARIATADYAAVR